MVANLIEHNTSVACLVSGYQLALTQSFIGARNYLTHSVIATKAQQAGQQSALHVKKNASKLLSRIFEDVSTILYSLYLGQPCLEDLLPANLK